MNNIEKLAIEAGFEVFNGRIGLLGAEKIHDVTAQLEAFAKAYADKMMVYELAKETVALQSSEPVAWRQRIEVTRNGVTTVEYGYSDFKVMVNDTPLFTLPPSTVQSNEPVGEIKIHMIGANDVCAIQCIGNYQPKVGDKLFTHPPASVPLEKYNKLLDALKRIASETQDTNLLWWQKEARQAIAEAEGKEG